MALTDNILAYWNLNDNGSGGVSLVDSTGNGNTLTNNGGVTLGAGIIEGSAELNLSNWLTSPSSPALGTGDFTLSAWVKTPSDSLYQEIFAVRDTSGDPAQFAFVLIPNNGLAFYNAEFPISIESVLTLGSWNYVALIRKNYNYYAYVNGIQVSSGTSSIINDYTGSVPFSIGAAFTGFEAFLGTIDEAGVWNRALTSTEITQLYNGGDGLTYPFQQFYFSGGDLSTLGNWWDDAGFTIPAASLPTSEDPVIISSAVTSGTATYASATITANIGSAVTITAMITLTNAVNSGTLIGTTTLNGTASNAGTITGNATVYHPAQNPLGGSVSGTITYIWPNGTGLWGGDVWIDGSISFIIPDPSDVKAGVEYGPPEDPYVGTFSGGGGIDLARLIGLPPFIQL